MDATGERFKYSVLQAGADLAQRVDIALGRSRLALAVIIVMAVASFAVVLWTPLHPLASSLLIVALALDAIAMLRCHAWRRSPRCVMRCQADCSRAIRVERRDGSECCGKMLDGSFVAPWLTIVRWRPDGSRLSRTILILPDMVDADEFRRLRVLLRWS